MKFAFEEVKNSEEFKKFIKGTNEEIIQIIVDGVYNLIKEGGVYKEAVWEYALKTKINFYDPNPKYYRSDHKGEYHAIWFVGKYKRSNIFVEHVFDIHNLMGIGNARTLVHMADNIVELVKREKYRVFSSFTKMEFYNFLLSPYSGPLTSIKRDFTTDIAFAMNKFFPAWDSFRVELLEDFLGDKFTRAEVEISKLVMWQRKQSFMGRIRQKEYNENKARINEILYKMLGVKTDDKKE